MFLKKLPLVLLVCIKIYDICQILLQDLSKLFFRSDLNDRDTDPFIEMFEALLPTNVTPHWVDDWEWYHLQLGEVHCGSNTKRQPVQEWWTYEE